MRGTAIDLRGFDGLRIEATGARLVFRGFTQALAVTECCAPGLFGCTIDWERPPFSQGEIVTVSANGRTATVRVDPEFPVDGSEAVSALATYDRESRLMARHGLDAYDVVRSIALVGAQVLRLDFKRSLPLRPGDTVVLRHAVYPEFAVTRHTCS
jgi:hypothetical protein